MSLRTDTLRGMIDKVKRRFDLSDASEAFIGDAEIREYINTGIDEAMASVNNNGERMLRRRAKIDLTPFVPDYDLPDDLYMHKILAVVYTRGENDYNVLPRIEQSKYADGYEYYLEDRNTTYGGSYGYLLLFGEDGKLKISLSPPPEQGTLYVHYLFQPQLLENENDEFNMPTLVHRFVINYALWLCALKAEENIEVYTLLLNSSKKSMEDSFLYSAPDGSSSIVEADYGILEQEYGYNPYTIGRRR